MTLNLNRFAKVVAFARSIPHEPSRHSQNQQKAAWNRAEAMAREAGMSLEAALSRLDRSGASHSAQAHWQPQEVEDLEAAVSSWREANPAASLFDAVRGVKPWPETVRAAVAELDEVDALRREIRRSRPRFDFGPSAFFVRTVLLEQFVERAHVTDPREAAARASWHARRDSGDYAERKDEAIAATIAADMADLANRISLLEERLAKSGARPAPRTNREKREAVAAILTEPGGWALSIRELARRAGVSIQGAKDIRISLQAETVSA